MSKITKSILMLQLLGNKGKWKISELSEKLGISERMVKYYKQNLEESGIKIKTIRGKNGGYQLEDNIEIPRLSLSEEDIENIENNKIDTLLSDKLKNNLYNEKNKYYSLLNKHDIKHSDMVNDFIEAIQKEKKVKLIYYGVSQKMTIRNVEPIDIFYYEGKVYLMAFCHLRKRILNFDLEHITEYFS